MDRLEQSALAHEALERRRPSLADHLQGSSSKPYMQWLSHTCTTMENGECQKAQRTPT